MRVVFPLTPQVIPEYVDDDLCKAFVYNSVAAGVKRAGLGEKY